MNQKCFIGTTAIHAIFPFKKLVHIYPLQLINAFICLYKAIENPKNLNGFLTYIFLFLFLQDKNTDAQQTAYNLYSL